MIVLLHGKDAFRIVRRRNGIREGFRRKYPGGTIAVIDTSERTGDIVSEIAAAGAGDLFASARLVDVREACILPEEVQEKIVGYLKTSGDGLSLLFSETTAPTATKHPLFAYLKKRAGSVETFGAFKSHEAEAFLEAELKKLSKDVSFSRGARQAVLAVAGSDSARLSSLAETLATYVGKGEISVADVALFVTPDPTASVFDALDALLAGDRGRAATILMREARAGGGVIKVFGLLAWQLRELFRVRGEYDRGNTRADGIARATGMKPFVAGKLLARMNQFPPARLKSGLSLLSSLDVDLKSGRIGDELALTLFVERL